MTLYLFNASVIPAGCDGFWQTETLPTGGITPYSVVSESRGDIVSAVGHESTAKLMAQLLKIDVPVNRVAVKPSPGDRLLCFKLNGRAPEGAILSKAELEAMGFQWILLTYHSSMGAAVDAEIKRLQATINHLKWTA